MRISKPQALAWSLSLLSSAPCIGCGGPTVGDIAGQEVTLGVVGIESAPEVAAVGEGRGGLGVSRAFVNASALELVPCSAEAGPIVLAPRGYDLLSTPPPSEIVTTAVSEFCNLRFDVDGLPEDAPGGIAAGTSLEVEGLDADGAPFKLSSQSSVSLSFEPEDGSSFGAQPLLLAFDLSVWLDGLPLPADMADMATPIFDSQLLDSAALYVDANGNQALDDDEQTPIAVAVPAR